jgi:hypothetical protein
LEDCAVRQIYRTDRFGIKADSSAFPPQSILSRILRKISARLQSAARLFFMHVGYRLSVGEEGMRSSTFLPNDHLS